MKLESITFEFSDVRTVDKPITGMNINIDIPTITTKGELLRTYFVYLVTYRPDESILRLGGFAEFSGAEVMEASKEWIKNKKLSGELGEKILNAVNYSASINAIFIARVFNLTPPISPPTLRIPEKKNLPPATKYPSKPVGKPPKK